MIRCRVCGGTPHPTVRWAVNEDCWPGQQEPVPGGLNACGDMHAFVELPDVIVTRHRGLVTYLVERGIVALSTPVVEHASARDISGRWVVGVLPIHLAALCDRVTEVPLALTPDMRGRELSAAEVAAIAGEPRTYLVREVKP